MAEGRLKTASKTAFRSGDERVVNKETWELLDQLDYL